MKHDYTKVIVKLFKQLITTPAVSRDEGKAADIIDENIEAYCFEYQREENNLLIIVPNLNPNLPVISLV